MIISYDEDEGIMGVIELRKKSLNEKPYDSIYVDDLVELWQDKDRVKVVRCKECKESRESVYFEEHPTCVFKAYRTLCCRMLKIAVDPDFYCGHGERRPE